MASTIPRWRPFADFGDPSDGVLELTIPLPKPEEKPSRTVKVHPR